MENLIKSLKENKTIYTETIRNKTGMSRQVSFFGRIDGEFMNISKILHELLEYRINKKGDALIFHGCGYDPTDFIKETLKSKFDIDVRFEKL